MPEIEYRPLSQADLSLMTDIMKREEQAWFSELDWDYSPIRRILSSFLEARILPGFLATCGPTALGYTYFLISRSKGVIGTIFSDTPQAQEICEKMLSRAIESLKGMQNVGRIEAQIIPLGGVDLNSIFSRHEFKCFLRHYLELDLSAGSWLEPSYAGKIVPWHPQYLLAASSVAFQSYRDGIDAVISDDYRSVATCEGYLRSLVENPGCGIFLPDSSFVGLDSRQCPCGFVLTSGLTEHSAMIPQISIHPLHQGKGLGSALVQLALNRLRSAGYRTVRLTVSHQNPRAYEWYLRLGFKIRRDFGAYVWQRVW
jgi:ribosomal protein S18 acetylase RimI-like enzyme